MDSMNCVWRPDPEVEEALAQLVNLARRKGYDRFTPSVTPNNVINCTAVVHGQHNHCYYDHNETNELIVRYMPTDERVEVA